MVHDLNDVIAIVPHTVCDNGVDLLKRNFIGLRLNNHVFKQQNRCVCSAHKKTLQDYLLCSAISQKQQVH